MVKDKIMIGLLIGLLADAVKLSINFALYLLNFTNVVFWQITATRFLERNDLFRPIAFLIGGVADIVVTAFLGIIFVYVIDYIGRENLWVKGVGFGMLIWDGLFGTLLSESVQAKLPQQPSGILVTIASHFFFGLGLAAFTALFYKVSNEDQEEKKEVITRFIPVPVKKVISPENVDSEILEEFNFKTPTGKLKKLIKSKKT